MTNSHPHEAVELRDLAAKIEQVAASHSAFSMVNEQVHQLCSNICLRARAIELAAQLLQSNAS